MGLTKEQVIFLYSHLPIGDDEYIEREYSDEHHSVREMLHHIKSEMDKIIIEDLICARGWFVFDGGNKQS